MRTVKVLNGLIKIAEGHLVSFLRYLHLVDSQAGIYSDIDNGLLHLNFCDEIFLLIWPFFSKK